MTTASIERNAPDGTEPRLTGREHNQHPEVYAERKPEALLCALLLGLLNDAKGFRHFGLYDTVVVWKRPKKSAICKTAGQPAVG